MTLATLTDKERADLLRDIAVTLGLNPETATSEQLFEEVCVARRAQNEAHWASIKLGRDE